MKIWKRGGVGRLILFQRRSNNLDQSVQPVKWYGHVGHGTVPWILIAMLKHLLGVALHSHEVACFPWCKRLSF
jgi:hypothetical protein